MRLLVATAVTAWIMKPPINISRQCLSDSCDAGGCFAHR